MSHQGGRGGQPHNNSLLSPAGCRGDGEDEPSFLATTPDGRYYLGDIPKTSTLEYKPSSVCNSPTKLSFRKESERSTFGFPVPGVPNVANNIRRTKETNLKQSRYGLRKGLMSRCSWKITAFIWMLLALCFLVGMLYAIVPSSLFGSYESAKACAVVVKDDLPTGNELEKSGYRHTSSNRAPGTYPKESFPPEGTTFAQVSLGDLTQKTIPPYRYWNLQFYQTDASYLRFNCTIPRGASIGLYARRNALPSHTHYDFLEILRGFKRMSRSSSPSITMEAVHYLEQGHWFISFYNDDRDPQTVSFNAKVATEMTENCPDGCSSNGECVAGKCDCFTGFGGDNCAKRVCPVLCNGNGEFIGGVCHCNPGWKGKECTLRHNECEIPDCSGHGQCIQGKCKCSKGFKGEFCAEVDCPNPTCSDHGFCMDGTCVCQKGWRGSDCAEMDTEALQCLPDCSGHGQFDLESLRCICQPSWTGQDCSSELCDLDCGFHGQCREGKCLCDHGWIGPRCTERYCDSRCAEHGQCKNGSCLCMTGWNGKHCTLEGCPGSCSSHGQCIMDGDAWKCKCDKGWEGPDCRVRLESSCNDRVDNDQDGLTDCEDSECCSTEYCKSNLLCISSADPIDILLRKQPPAITASFYQRMRFLIEEGSLQSYARSDSFNESRAAVIRGRVVGPTGSGLLGVRVGTDNPLEGFTLTRSTGWFDLMVNGGGAINIKFGRKPFRSQKTTIFVPWNEVVILDPVVMSLSEDVPDESEIQACPDHDYDIMKPVVLATWKHGFQGGCPDRSAILTESQVVQESLKIPGTDLHLVYHSSRVGGYMSTIQLQLTPDEVPPSLRRIFLKISIEGILFEKVFEADPGIKYTYAWNRYNVYRQKVYGVTTAVVKVGYEYDKCSKILWDFQTTKLSGHDMSISEIGGWNLDIHHRYNFHEGILQKGDGTNTYLKYQPKILLTTMGNGKQRPVECPLVSKPTIPGMTLCEGPAKDQQLLTPGALAAGMDGSIYIGDYNLIRKILSDGTVRTVVKLNGSHVSYRYHLAVSPLDGTVYISDPENHQILRIKNNSDYTHPEKNWEPIIGSGERCIPGDEMLCGDTGLARDAKLAYPKGIVLSASNHIYFADGTNIRVVDPDGIINTVLGDHLHKGHWKPMTCSGTLSDEEIQLRWPSELAINPLDDSLHIIDDHMILKLTADGRIKVVAGQPLHCPPLFTDPQPDLATHATLLSLQSIAFAPNGDLYVAESDSQRVNRVRVITTDGKISDFAGSESKCNCLDHGCSCFDNDHFLAATSRFNTISSITVTPDGILHICDQGNLRIRSVTSSLPESNRMREYDIYSPTTQETYVFNRFGQHILTRNIVSGKIIYSFSYNVNTSNGKLSTVTDAAGNKLSILRDYSNQVNSIENTKNQKCWVRMSRMKMLQNFVTPDNYNITFDYQGATGLLRSKTDGFGISSRYTYDENGRLLATITSTGEHVALSFDLSIKGASVTVTRDSVVPVTTLIKKNSVIMTTGEAEEKVSLHQDGSVITSAPWHSIISTETTPYALLGEKHPAFSESFPIPGRQKVDISNELVNRFEWKYYLRREGRGKNKKVTQIGRKMRVNGDNLLTLEYDMATGTEAIFNEGKSELLNLTYDDLGRPYKWNAGSSFVGVTLSYDRYGRLLKWQRGEMSENYAYDRVGRLEQVRYPDFTYLGYVFTDTSSYMPSKFVLPNGLSYSLKYDGNGGLVSIMTPAGHMHKFLLQVSVGFYKYLYKPPGFLHPFFLTFNDQGLIQSVVRPEFTQRITYIYNNVSRLQNVFYGDSQEQFSYFRKTGLLKSVLQEERKFRVKMEFRYHAGLVKSAEYQYLPDSGLHDIVFRYQYDGNARLQKIDCEINGEEQSQVYIRYNNNLGFLEAEGDFRTSRPNYNTTITQDTTKQFSYITTLDNYGRLKTILMSIKGTNVFSLLLEYDNRNRLTSKKVVLSRTLTTYNYTYSPCGYLTSATAQNDNRWAYEHDKNGNIIKVTEVDKVVSIGYDNMYDRAIEYGDEQFSSYDLAGNMVMKGKTRFIYNGKGMLRIAQKNGTFTVHYYFDYLKRLIVMVDSTGKNIQFLYSNPDKPRLVTQVHFPADSRTIKLLYNNVNHVMVMEEGNQRYYVATDQVGTPLAVFGGDGTVVKTILRSPFGLIIEDSNPEFLLPIGFQGGIEDPWTKLLHFDGRIYDPLTAQWLTPYWMDVLDNMKSLQGIHLYRFNNNDPINSLRSMDQYMTDLPDWMKLYGYDLEKILGSHYVTSYLNDFPPHSRIPNSSPLFPSLEVISGLKYAIDVVNKGFMDLAYKSPSKVKHEPQQWDLVPRISCTKTVFSSGLLVSRVNGRAIVNTIEGVNYIVKDVLTSVLNNSYFMDFHFSSPNHDVFYFIKDNPSRRSEDVDQLMRLGSMYNVSVHDTESGNALRIYNGGMGIYVHYTDNVDLERHRILRNLHKIAIEQAWLHERQILKESQFTRYEWSESERSEILNKGRVANYLGENVRSIHKFPVLANDPNNVILIRNSNRKRRKIRKPRGYSWPES